MSKAQTDIRTTSYDAMTANPDGYQGTIDDAISNIRVEIDVPLHSPGYTRRELERFLGVEDSWSNGPSVELDTNVRYGEEPAAVLGIYDPGFYGLANAKARGLI